MICSKCDTYLDYDCAMGYGDYKCNNCGNIEYGDEEYEENLLKSVFGDD